MQLSILYIEVTFKEDLQLSEVNKLYQVYQVNDVHFCMRYDVIVHHMNNLSAL